MRTKEKQSIRLDPLIVRKNNAIHLERSIAKVSASLQRT